MITKYTITSETISHTDIKLMVQNNFTKYPNHRRRYEFYCSYGLFWANQDYINKTIKDIVDTFGMRYLVVPTIGENLEKQIVIIFDMSESLFEDTCDLVYGKYLKTESNLDATNSALQSHCENQKKEINLLLKQKAKLEKELKECENRQVDMLAYRDDIIGEITRKKNELEHANKCQTRYINEMEENMSKGNERHKKLKDRYDKLEAAYEKLSSDHDILKEKYEKKKRLINSVYGSSQQELQKANNFYHDKIHEMFDMLLMAEFRQKKEEKEAEKDD